MSLTEKKDCRSCKWCNIKTWECTNTKHPITIMKYPEYPCPDWEKDDEATLKGLTLSDGI